MRCYTIIELQIHFKFTLKRIIEVEEESMMNILLLEDEQIISDVIFEYLKEENIEMENVKSGEGAIEKLRHVKYDLAILDIMVSGELSGIDVLRWIRYQNINLPVIMLSALSDEDTQVEAFDEDADDYVTKPFSPRLLLRRIEAVVKRHQIAQMNIEHTVSTEALVASLESYQFFYYGKSLHFTLSEFMLFHAMYQHPGRIFTRDQLLDVIYRDDVFPSDRVIDAHIKNIRKKLPCDVIRTCKGIGYTYEEEK